MFFLETIDSNQQKKELLDKVMCIKSGNRDLREQFVSENIPHIIKIVSITVGKFVDIKNSEEYAVALDAFNDAIDRFNPRKNDNFISYSDLIMKNRVMDYLRQNQKHQHVYSATSLEENGINIGDDVFSLNSFDSFDHNDQVRELSIFTQNLKKFGIPLESLVKLTPKHKNLIKTFINAGMTISKDAVMYQKLMALKILPSKELSTLLSIDINTLEKNKKFIIAVCLILRSNLNIMRCFLKVSAKGGDD